MMMIALRIDGFEPIVDKGVPAYDRYNFRQLSGEALRVSISYIVGQGRRT